MKLKLIEAGGFAGLKKTTEEDLSDYPLHLQQEIKEVFEQPLPKPAPTPARDKEQHFLELDGKVIPVASITPTKELRSLIKKMKSNLDE